MSEVSFQWLDDILSHHGVKGMKWGVRKDRSTQNVTVSDRPGRKKLKAKGGENWVATTEAVRTRSQGQVISKSGVKALTNKELQEYTQRLNLEQNAKRLHHNEKSSAGRFIAGILGNTAKNQAQSLANDAAATQVKKAMAKRALKTAAVAAIA